MIESIKAILIFEMLGKPADHLKSTLEQFIERISKEKDVEVKEKKIHEPKEFTEHKELFTTFAEVEINFKDLLSLIKFVFVFMPSHIEIISPEEIKLKNFELNEFTNELIKKLHQYDEIAKRLVMERNILQNQLQQQGVKPAISSVGEIKEEAKKTEKIKKIKAKKTENIKKGKKKVKTIGTVKEKRKRAKVYS